MVEEDSLGAPAPKQSITEGAGGPTSSDVQEAPQLGSQGMDIDAVLEGVASSRPIGGAIGFPFKLCMVPMAHIDLDNEPQVSGEAWLRAELCIDQSSWWVERALFGSLFAHDGALSWFLQNSTVFPK